MSILERAIIQRNDDKAAYHAQKQAQMDGLYADVKAMLPVAFSQQVFMKYLVMQANNPFTRPNNLLLIMRQMPEATIVASFDRWKERGRSVVPQPSMINVIVRDPYTVSREQTDLNRSTGEVVSRMVSEQRMGYRAGIVFDISQTAGRDLPPMPALEEGSPALEKATAALLAASPVDVSIEVSPKKGFTAQYDPVLQTIRVASGLPDTQAFTALAKEIAHADMARNIGSTYDRAAHEIKASATAYVVCARYGHTLPELKPDKAEAWAQGKDEETIRSSLTGIHFAAKRMISQIDRAIAPPELQHEQRRAEPFRNGEAR